MRVQRVTKPNARVFVTQVTWNRDPYLGEQRNVDLLMEVLRECKAKHPFRMIAFVILPDHLHVLVAPQDEVTISSIMGALKASFSIRYRKRTGLGERTLLWQKGFWDHIIRDEEDVRRHIDYIHYNPVKHGLVERPEAWARSSYLWWKNAGHYPEAWGWSNLPEEWTGSVQSWPDGME